MKIGPKTAKAYKPMNSFRDIIGKSPFRVKLPKLKVFSKLENGFNQKDRKAYFLKLHKYYDFLIKINLSNNQVIKWGSDNRNYRAVVGKGNNFQIIKHAFKSRYLIHLCVDN